MKKVLLPLTAIILLLLMVALMAGYFRDKVEPGLAELPQYDASTAVAVELRSGPFSEPVPASERAEELHRRGLIAVAARDAARADAAALEADLSSARQALQEAEAAVAFSEIRSPIAGRVVDRFAEPGDTASPGSKLLSLYNPFSLRVEARVRETLALSLEMGQELAVEIPSLRQQISARIEEIVPAADPGSRSFLVKATLPAEQKLMPGMYARLLVPAGERRRLLVPSDRVARVGQLDMVWVASESGAVRRFVRLGPDVPEGQVEVISGLEPEERILPLP